MELSPGKRYASQVCTTEVVVVRGGSIDGDLTCGGTPMVPAGDVTPSGDPATGFDGGTLVGKRYTDGSDLELLAVKAGSGALAVGESLLEIKSAKPLPSSD